MMTLPKADGPSSPRPGRNSRLMSDDRHGHGGRRLIRTKVRLLRFLRTDEEEEREDRAEGSEERISFPHQIIEHGLEVVVGRGDLLDVEAGSTTSPGRRPKNRSRSFVSKRTVSAPAKRTFRTDGSPTRRAAEGPRVAAADRDDMGMRVDQVADVWMSPWARILPWWMRTIDLRQGLDLGQDVARDEDRPPLRPIVLDEPDDLALAQRVEAVERLVQDEDLGFVGDGLGDFQPLAHPPAVAADQPVLCPRQARRRPGPGRPGPRPRPRRISGQAEAARIRNSRPVVSS